MTNLIHDVQAPAEISTAAAQLRQRLVEREILPREVMAVFDAWAASLDARDLDDIPGILFLRMWLKRGNLEPIITRELGANALDGGWTQCGHAQCKACPVGLVGHWPAGNVEIQPLLSMTCALLGGNAALVRVPLGLAGLTRRMMAKLEQSDPGQVLTSRIFMAAFEHGRQDLHEAMAQSVDGAMIWGGKESVLTVRALPFPHWARIAVFGPRMSVAAMDAGAWNNPAAQETWCGRLARDVWQFDQQACSSPQVLFLENETGLPASPFLSVLQRAFAAENKAHPRLTIASGLTSAICQARTAWLLQDTDHRAVFPMPPDWTLLFGAGSDLPQPTQGKTLTVLEVKNLFEAVSKFDGVIQSLGLGMADPEKEAKLAGLAARRGVDRIVKLGRMHAFVPPWDGVDLVRPMVRMVRHVPSSV
ncbi:MAG: acyl-CoA reductase [Verrucomicrobiota bacterium]